MVLEQPNQYEMTVTGLTKFKRGLHKHSQAFMGLLEQPFFFTRPADRADRARASLRQNHYEDSHITH